MGRKKQVRGFCICGCGKKVPVLGQMAYSRQHSVDFKNSNRINSQQTALNKRAKKVNKYLVMMLDTLHKKKNAIVFEKAIKGDVLAREALSQLHMTRIFHKGAWIDLTENLTNAKADYA